MIIQGDLILVLMEDALRVISAGHIVIKKAGLNPCSNGRCSASLTLYDILLEETGVLILVLMEDALRVINN